MYATLTAAIADAGKITSGNTKMPGTSFPISATVCKTGSKLAEVDGSVCHKCYAIKLEKLRPSVHQGWMANYLKATKLIETNPEQWAQACAFQINRAVAKGGQPYHRWFDSGDLQSVAMLKAIVRVCELTPSVKHWLPTRELGIIQQAEDEGLDCPANLVVRLSSTMVGDKPRLSLMNTSTVHKAGDVPYGHVCPARHQGNACGECRACWTGAINNVSYPLH